MRLAATVLLRLSVLCLIGLTGCMTPGSVLTQPSAQTATTAFVGVTVVGMTRSAESVPNQTVIVQQGQIQAVGARTEVAVPDNAVRIDGAGKYLMPGLADMHVHLEYFDDPSLLKLFVINGVTTVRNMDGRPRILEWKKQIEDGTLIGPAIYTAGPLLDGDPPVRSDNTVVRNAAEARAAVLDQKEAGYDFIKVYTNLSGEAYEAVVATAWEQDLPVAGHVPTAVGLKRAMSGQASIEHLGDYADAVEADDSPFRNRNQWFKRFLGMPMDRTKAAVLGKEQARQGAWTVPTLVQADRELAPADQIRQWTSAPEMASIPANIRSAWEEQTRRATARMDQEDWRRVALGRQHRLLLVGAFHESGAQLLTGSDTPNPFVIPGFSLRDELKNFVEAGLTAWEALAASTRDAARFADQLDGRGTVEPGQRADLLLLDANPLEDVTNVGKLAGVMARGRWFPREELTQMVDALRQPPVVQAR
ncbi:MAG TPA: amidohydrolase family protein [Vicinamibacterales bacterium]|jgi:imidazolonepropionase-like amidohydrolase